MKRSVTVIAPEGVDDPARPSGGNRYDMGLLQELPELGWEAQLLPVPGSWPLPSANDRSSLAGVLDELPEGSIVLVDGLVGACVPAEMEAAAQRLHLVLLVHMPLANDTGRAPEQAALLDAAERRVLHSAAATVATSSHTADYVTAHHGLRADTVHVAVPGVREEPVTALGYGGDLLCVANLTPGKGISVIIRALAGLTDLAWHLRLVGRLDADPAHVASLKAQIGAADLNSRITLTGTLTGADLDSAYRTSDLLVLPSFQETYGMCVTEALSRSVPVFASHVGGVPEAVGSVRRERPGRLLPPGDDEAWATALREWLVDADLRARMKEVARQRRHSLPTWRATALSVIEALYGRPSNRPAPTTTSVFTMPYPWPPKQPVAPTVDATAAGEESR
ncbi:glycosyltransferase family 4 protein [Streptomyces sp. NPDC048638]|uniref:glycosyltransferase family 4 protein n=1 Tax=Streptomyces sp. NPDC048638 TaxID=3365580 RepID=UPI0037153185